MNSAKVHLMKHVMQKHEDPLNLQGLPLVSPTVDGWPAIEEALRRDGRKRTFNRLAVSALAAAATVALAFGLVLRPAGTGSPGPQSELSVNQRLAQAEQPAMAESAAGAGAAPSSEPASLDTLIALSQRMEGRLRRIRADVGDLPSGAMVYQVELEDLVVQVDEELSRQPDSLALWSQRVDLLMDLERLYENRLRREYHRVASL
jgi:hypothetical protein